MPLALLLTLTLLLPRAPAYAGCTGGRFVVTVDQVQHQNWNAGSPTVYEQKQTSLRLPRWLGAFKLTHASQGYLLSGEERIGAWTVVTVRPSLTLTMHFFGKHIYWPILLPVMRDYQACRDDHGRLYVRQ